MWEESSNIPQCPDQQQPGGPQPAHPAQVASASAAMWTFFPKNFGCLSQPVGWLPEEPAKGLSFVSPDSLEFPGPETGGGVDRKWAGGNI